MLDGPTRSCCPLDTEYETGPIKGRKRKAEVRNPKEMLKRDRQEKSKGKGKGKTTSGTLDKEGSSGSRTAKTLKSVD